MKSKPTAPPQTNRTVYFKGKSGERYAFQACSIGTKFKPLGGVYLVTRRTYEDRTFATKASHHAVAIGQTPDLAVALAATAELNKLVAKGANCICVYAVADAARRAEIERDLVDGNEQWGGRLQYLFHAPVSEKMPGVSPPSR